MAELVLTGMSEEVLHQLQDRATRRRRTAAEEAKAILSGVLRTQDREGWTRVDAIYDRLAAAGGDFSDSAELLREDRDR